MWLLLLVEWNLTEFEIWQRLKGTRQKKKRKKKKKKKMKKKKKKKLHAPLATKQRRDATASRLAPPKKKQKRNFLSAFQFFIFVLCRSFIFWERERERERGANSGRNWHLMDGLQLHSAADCVNLSSSFATCCPTTSKNRKESSRILKNPQKQTLENELKMKETLGN